MKKDEFMPEEHLTRGMAVTILYRVDGSKEQNELQFDDVDKDAYYANAIAWAAKNKIVLGTGNNKFEPDEKITRQDLATIVYRYAKLKDKELNGEIELDYEDKSKISNYAYDAIVWCTKEKILEGTNENKVEPKSYTTRAEAAKIFVMLVDVMK